MITDLEALIFTGLSALVVWLGPDLSAVLLS